MPGSTRVVQALKGIPFAQRTQQSWQAPIRQKPTLNSLLNSNRRKSRARRRMAVSTVSPPMALADCPSMVHWTSRRSKAATRWNWPRVPGTWLTLLVSWLYCQQNGTLHTVRNGIAFSPGRRDLRPSFRPLAAVLYIRGLYRRFAASSRERSRRSLIALRRCPSMPRRDRRGIFLGQACVVHLGFVTKYLNNLCLHKL